MPRGNYVYMPVLLCCEILQITNIDASEYTRGQKRQHSRLLVLFLRGQIKALVVICKRDYVGTEEDGKGF